MYSIQCTVQHYNIQYTIYSIPPLNPTRPTGCTRNLKFINPEPKAIWRLRGRHGPGTICPDWICIAQPASSSTKSVNSRSSYTPPPPSSTSPSPHFTILHHTSLHSTTRPHPTRQGRRCPSHTLRRGNSTGAHQYHHAIPAIHAREEPQHESNRLGSHRPDNRHDCGDVWSIIILYSTRVQYRPSLSCSLK